MAWVSISNSAIDQDSPITVSLMTALRDNPAAIANGDAGAPLIQTAGLQDGLLTLAKFPNAQAGSYQLWSAWNTAVENEGDYEEWVYSIWYRVAVRKAGTYRTHLNVTKTAGFTGSYISAQISRNGTRIGSACTGSTNNEAAILEQDITVSAGDVLSFQYFRHHTGSSSFDVTGGIILRIGAHVPFDFYLGQSMP